MIHCLLYHLSVPTIRAYLLLLGFLFAPSLIGVLIHLHPRIFTSVYQSSVYEGHNPLS